MSLEYFLDEGDRLGKPAGGKRGAIEKARRAEEKRNVLFAQGLWPILEPVNGPEGDPHPFFSGL